MSTDVTSHEINQMHKTYNQKFIVEIEMTDCKAEWTCKY